MTLPATPTSARAARSFLAAVVSLHDDGRAALVASELVTNAIVHTRAPLRFGVTAEPDSLRIEVSDSEDRLPVQRRANAENVGGRGLTLVTALADEWGVVPRPDGGKTVWARLPR